MSSFVIVELDTTAPIIEIYAPRYTTNDAINMITIESNEDLGDYQDIYLIDSNNDRFDLTFHRETSRKYVGNISFNGAKTGVVEIFATLKDEVDNPSNTITVAIEIKETLIKSFSRVSDISKSEVSISDKNRKISINDNSRKVVVEELQLR